MQLRRLRQEYQRVDMVSDLMPSLSGVDIVCRQASQYDSLFDGMDWYKGLANEPASAGAAPTSAAAPAQEAAPSSQKVAQPSEEDAVLSQKQKLEAVGCDAFENAPATSTEMRDA